MNTGFYMCVILGILFFMLGLLFAIGKEKAAVFVSGFNSLPKQEQKLYDKAYLSRDMRNQCFTWFAIMVIGAVFAYLVGAFMAILAFLVWLIVFFKEAHLDARKAFEKYLLKRDEGESKF